MSDLTWIVKHPRRNVARIDQGPFQMRLERVDLGALRRHKERGESIVIWRDGKIVTLTADEIDV